ncbi:MAG TPA: acetamidase/formamidase family protein [Acidimicrobiales bacterium]|nr:acetamidase/formamidase family protein [Acidimicrobiales bacterium]
MTTSSLHVLRAQIHHGWSRDHVPVLSVPSGSEIAFETTDASGGQIRPGSTHESVRDLDFERVNPVSGPVYVEGARPGDTLQVDILAVEPGAYGWTGIIPGFGLLADRFPDPWLYVWELEGGHAQFTEDVRVPLQPFCGVLGVAPAESGLHSVVPPRRVGGNLDTRQLGPGATLYLPVEVEGALFGVGDTHAAQGDGEVCGTAIEATMSVTLRLSVRPDLQVDTPEFDLTRPLERPGAAAAGYHATTGVGPDLMEAARQSVEAMITHLEARRRLSREQAYALCSVAADLRLSEVVDAPNWVVSAFLPNDLFRAGES